MSIRKIDTIPMAEPIPALIALFCRYLILMSHGGNLQGLKEGSLSANPWLLHYNLYSKTRTETLQHNIYVQIYLLRYLYIIFYLHWLRYPEQFIYLEQCINISCL